MSEYPDGFEPFTDEEMREIFLARDLEEWAKLNPEHRNASGKDWDTWLTAHDADVRAGVVAEEPGWEYGISSGHGSVNYVGTRESVDRWLRSFEKAGAPLNNGERVVRRRKVGLWTPVNQKEETE